MQKPTILTLAAATIIVVAIGLLFYKLPLELKRRKDIKLGNECIANIEEYRMQHGELPPTDSWELLKTLGFELKLLGTKPSHQKANHEEYLLVFLEGFNAPYLFYSSKTKKWQMGNP